MIHLIRFSLLACLLFWGHYAQAQYLKISNNKRFLVTEDACPFFWLGDTGWELLHRLDSDEGEYYLRDRAAKGFTVIQTVILSELNGLTDTTPAGHLPLHDLDPAKPNEAYFEHVDRMVDYAAGQGLYMALLPTWGAHAEDKHNWILGNHAIFTPENARQFGRFLGERYKDRWNVVWVLGGDRPADRALGIWEAMAKGLQEGDQGKHLITYHPMGYQTSSQWLHNKDWLDFNMVQSGHGTFQIPNDELVEHDYGLKPVKPVLDAEPNYETMGVGFNAANGRFGEFEVRRAAYWSVFSGSFGHTYGHNSIWQMYAPGRFSVLDPSCSWEKALEAPGGKQMKHLKNLMLSRPFLTRIPDQSLLILDNETAIMGYKATRDGTAGNNDATYIMVYLPVVRRCTVNTSVIKAKKLQVYWYSPRTGQAIDLGLYDNSGKLDIKWEHRIRQYQGRPDWVLLIDDPGKQYPPPGLPLPCRE